MQELGALLSGVRAAGPAKRGALYVLRCELIERVDPLALWGAGVEGARAVWCPQRDAWERFAFAGAGAAERLPADALGRVSSFEYVTAGEGPAPRWVGAMAFAREPAAERDPAWRGFGSGDFVLPRWTLYCDDERSYLQWALRGDELDGLGLEAECARVTRAVRRSRESSCSPESSVQDELSPEAWGALVQRALGAVRARAFAKVVLARRTRLALRDGASTEAVLERLRATQRGCTVFAVERGDGVFLGATPERLVAVRERRVSVDALAGSVPRAKEPVEDARARAGLACDDKEKREHAHVVWAVREALAALCVPGSVRAPDGPAVRSLAAVHHLHTPVEGALREEVSALDALARLHPTPAVCGTPRATSLEFLSSNEPAPRGWYAGPVGWVDAAGDASFCVALRSGVLRGRDAWVYAGAGLVEGSDPAREYAETAAKQRAMLDALGAGR